MTSYSRSVIPGRQPGEGELDKQMFGDAKAKAAPANDAAQDEDDDPPPIRERRVSKRRKDDFLPLTGDGARTPKPPEEKKAPLVLIGVLVTLAVFGVVVWNAYQQGVRPEDAAATPALADAGPFKARPFAEPTPTTGVEQAGVFERMEKGKSEKLAHNPDVRDEPAAAAAKPAPAPAKPAVAAAAMPAPAAPAPAAKVAAAAPTPAKPAPATPAPATPAPQKVAAATPAPAAPAPATPAPVKAATPAPLAVPAAATPAPAAPAPQKLAGGYAPVFAADGKYVVQVAAPSTEAAAGAEWDKKLKAMPELFGSAERIIVRADVNGKTVYRVRAGSFATAADAEGFCAAIKAKGGDCFRTAR